MPSEKSSLELEAVTPPSGATVANGVAQPNGDLEHAVETHTVTSSRARTCAEIAVLCLVIGLVWGLLALPTVFYHLPQDTAEAGCSSPEVYSGICQGYLQQQQTCLGVTGNGVSVPRGRGDEMQAQLFITGLPSFLTLSPGCDAVIEQFLCFYIFGLCDGSGELYLPSPGECRMVTEETCGPELEQAMTFIAGIPGIQLPQCDTLPVSSTPGSLECLAGNVTGSGESPDVGTSTSNGTSVLTTRECNDGFYESSLGNTTVCRPECGEWEEFSHGTVVAVNAIIIIQAVVYFISGAVVLVLSILRRHHMFSFPAVFVVYGTITLGVNEAVILIGTFDQKSLFCSSRDLEESFNKSTTFCTIQGFLFFYTSFLQTLLWLCHVTAVFFAVTFPFQARSFQSKGYYKYIHAVMLIVALIIPWIAVGVAFGTGGFQLTRFPTIFCYSANTDVTFYALILPICIILAIGISMIAGIFAVLIKLVQKQKLRSGRKHLRGSIRAALKPSIAMGTAELKILIVFLYSVAFAVISLVAFTFGARGYPQFLEEIRAYFVCESAGINSGQVCDRSFERLSTEILLDAGLIFVGLYPLVYLVYVINVRELKQMFRRWREDSSHPKTVSISVNSKDQL